MVRWTSAILEAFVAPRLTGFTRADIRDLSDEYPQAPYWLGNHLLNNALRGAFPDRYRQAMMAFLRRTSHAFRSYHEARDLTAAYLDGNDPYNPHLHHYYDALNAWETFVLQSAMAVDIIRWLNGCDVFHKNDGSREQRLYGIANHIKHTTSCIESGQCSSSDTIPLWLANDGLASFGIKVSYAEAADILSALAAEANRVEDATGFLKHVGEGRASE